MIKKRFNLALIDNPRIDVVLTGDRKEIFMPHINDDKFFQLSITELYGRPLGILRIHNDEQFETLIKAIQSLPFYEDFEKIGV